MSASAHDAGSESKALTKRTRPAAEDLGIEYEHPPELNDDAAAALAAIIRADREQPPLDRAQAGSDSLAIVRPAERNCRP